MSRRSKERKRRLAAEMLARSVNSQPVTGNMEERAAVIVKTEASGQQVGHVPVEPKVDSRLPVHYGGGFRYPYETPFNGHGYKNPPTGHIDVSSSKLANSGYKTVDEDETIFRVTSTDIIKGDCPIAKTPKVYVGSRLWNEWISLADDYDIEWLAYLTGQFVSDDNGPRYEIRTMYFPPQVAHASHVEVDDDFTEYKPNTIGAIHSHVKMGVFFSGEDLAHSNWPVEIVVNAMGEVKVLVRHQLECGKWIKNYSEILTVGDQADKRNVEALDRAFAEGKRLEDIRVRTKSAKAGYRTPDVSSQPLSQPSTSYLFADPDWHFKINDVPMEWDSNKNQYVEVVKVNGKWIKKTEITKADEACIANEHPPDSTGHSLTNTEKDILDGSVTIDEATGQILIDGEKSQTEIDMGMEAAIDQATCEDCDGTGTLDANGTEIECTGCGGKGIKPDYFRGYESTVC